MTACQDHHWLDLNPNTQRCSKCFETRFRCEVCKGSGQIKQVCRTCSGTGEVNTDTCSSPPCHNSKYGPDYYCSNHAGGYNPKWEKCPKCLGEKQAMYPCGKCGGTGWHQQSSHKNKP